MTILESIKKNLGFELKNEVVSEPSTEGGEEKDPLFSEDQMSLIEELVKAAIGDALKAKDDEIGNTIATVLNSIVSEDNAPTRQTVGVDYQDQNMDQDAIMMNAFNKKMGEIKAKAQA